MILWSAFILLLIEIGFDLGSGDTMSLNEEGECIGKISKLLCD